jgi:hypothetical protein
MGVFHYKPRSAVFLLKKTVKNNLTNCSFYFNFIF